MPKYINTEGKDTSEAVVLKTYFGFHPNQTLQEFMNEVRALTPEAKTELAIGAANNLGYTVIQ